MDWRRLETHTEKKNGLFRKGNKYSDHVWGSGIRGPCLFPRFSVPSIAVPEALGYIIMMVCQWSAAKLVSVLCLARYASAIPQGASSVTAPPSLSSEAATFSTATPSPTLPLSASVPSGVPLPPVQAWCPSQIFCAGEVRAFFQENTFS